MADTPPDVESYFKRIDYRDTPAADLRTLRALHLRHAQTIPFENLNPLLRLPVRLDLESLEQKLIHDGRGGYCFEQNRLFSQVLRHLGYRVTDLAARVIWNAPPDAPIRARQHMLLRVDLDESSYLADVGFGGLTLTVPLRLQTDIAQATSHEEFRLVALEGDLVMQARLQDTWRPLYRFDLQRQYAPDYEVSSWYLCHHPESQFVNHLIAARTIPGGRYALLNNRLTEHRLGGESVVRLLHSGAELRAVLEGAFGLRLPDEPGLEDTLGRLAAVSPVS